MKHALDSQSCTVFDLVIIFILFVFVGSECKELMNYE
jgi:hypothetical protein